MLLAQLNEDAKEESTTASVQETTDGDGEVLPTDPNNIEASGQDGGK